MTQPRRHIPGQVTMLTRRCLERRYFLRPDDFINDVVAFELGKASNAHSQEVYAAVAMSNHVHFGVGDTNAERSRLMQDSMSGIARARNCDLGRKGPFWGGTYGDTVLLNKNTIERKLLYIWLNPVRAGLVERAEDWPGFIILPKHWGKKIRIEKPGKFYGRRNPDVVEFVPQPPPGYQDMALEEARAYFEELIRLAEDEIAAIRKELGLGSVTGADAVCRVDPDDKPTTEEPKRRINPRFATRDKALMASAKASYREFLDEYESQRQRWLQGKPGVAFPCGTVALKRRAPITCKAPKDDEPGLFCTGKG